MIDYEINEVRHIRHQVSEENGHDLRRVVDYYRRVEQELRACKKFRFADDRDPEMVSGTFATSNETV